MEKILFINACVRPNSRTLDLAKYVIEKLLGEVEEVKLCDEKLLPLTLKEMNLRDKANKNKDFSSDIFDLAKQFALADTIVLAAPYWDLMFPAVVKNYFENITVNGLTFAYGKNGIPYGLCKAKKLIYVTTSGGPITCNFGFDYVNALSKSFYNIPNVQCVSAQGLDIYGANVSKIMEQAKKTINL
jgi:FMN-dependent NADH-azoreductase